MGFKRTTEGRVYFQGAEEGAAAKKADFRTISQAAPQQSTQFQILSLLRALNDKLKDAQGERAKMRLELESYRKQIEDLEGKVGKGDNKGDKGVAARAERAEKIAEDTFKELKETRKLILEIEDKTEKADKGMLTLQRQMVQAKAVTEEMAKQQANVDALAKRLEDSETRHEDLNQKIEKTAVEQSRILRQIEKVAEDRARFMRKIERIEETVVQTRDALSAKAMVLLTEQGARSAAGASPSIVQQVTAPRQDRPKTQDTRWQDSFIFQAGVAVAVLALGVLGGWAVSKIREIPFPLHQYQTADIGASADVTQTQPAEETFSTEESENQSEDQAANQTDTYSPEENTEENTGETITEEAPQPLPETSIPPPPAVTAADDIGTVDVQDEQKLARMLDENPDKVAAELNKIEPGTKAEPEKVAEAMPVEPAPPPPAAKPVRQPETVAAEPAPKKQDLNKLMKHDPSLPLEAKEIERQAYDGVPEAQHDLAAIYTAGQGGVKQDYKRAAFWFHQAADQGIANAAYNLGVLYHQGLGMKADIKEAIKWYKQAAVLNHPEAQYNLGIAYIEGIGVGYDPAKAAENFEKAAKAGITEAAYNLGLIYENGLLGQPQPDQALKWYKIAADKGSPEAKEALEQLARSLNIKVEDINRIADEVKSDKKVEAVEPAAGDQIKIAALSDGVAATVTHENRQAMLAKIQEHLMLAGLYPGPADGIGGALTEDAIRAYQARNSLPVNGEPSEDLLRVMTVKTLEAEEPSIND